MRILVVEDDPVGRMVERATRYLGHVPAVAHDAQRAWEHIVHRGADVVIGDGGMRSSDALELCRRIRAHDAAYTYIILLAAGQAHAERVAGMRAGADDYLATPLDPDELALRLIAAERVTALHRRLGEQRAELERLNSELYALGRRDALTGIGNRRKMDEDLAALGARLGAGAEAWAHGQADIVLALFDFDSFKGYNDTYSHVAADEVLRIVARVLAGALGPADTIYRYGGEEFLVVMHLELEAGVARVEAMRAAVEGLAIPHTASTTAEVVTVSAGVAAIRRGDASPIMGAIRAADQALFRAKRTGKNRVEVAR